VSAAKGSYCWLNTAGDKFARQVFKSPARSSLPNEPFRHVARPRKMMCGLRLRAEFHVRAANGSHDASRGQ
jgi:hypothetical protein